MKKGLAKRILCMLMTLALCLSMLAGCGDNGQGDKDTEGSKGNNSGTTNEKISGDVVLAVPSWNIMDMQILIDDFIALYPNVNVTIDGFDGDPQTYLTAQASSGTLPDALWGDWGSMPFNISQGWLQPLEKFLEADEDSKYISQSLLADVTFNGHIYAIPQGIQYNCIAVNKDLVDELNLDMPEYDWTVDDFVEFVKSGATTTTSGIELLAGIDEHLTAINNPGYGVDGYNVETKEFNLSETWIDAVNLFRNLRVTPHVEAWASRQAVDANEVTDYEKKFGVTDITDMAAAFKTGKVLTLFCGTYDDSWLRYMPFEYELYPLPQSSDGTVRMPIHANHTYMLETCEDQEAAFELIKFLTYGVEGNMSMIETYEAKDPDDVTSGYLWYFPSTTHPTIVEKMKENEFFTDGLLYMYTHSNDTYRGDMDKLVPGWTQVFGELVGPKGNEVRDGSKEAASVAAEIDREATKQIQNYWTDFESKLEALD